MIETVRDLVFKLLTLPDLEAPVGIHDRKGRWKEQREESDYWSSPVDSVVQLSPSNEGEDSPGRVLLLCGVKEPQWIEELKI